MTLAPPATQSRFSKFIDKNQEYLSEFVYGGIDGSITTFAIVAGAVGAELSSSIIIIMGFANLLADGFSMSVGAFLSAKSENENFEKHLKKEYWEVDNLPEIERQEIREIYEAKGFKGALLEKIVAVITSDRDVWVEVMMKEELEMIKDKKTAFTVGLVTFISFIILGLLPLTVYILDFFNPIEGNLMLYASVLTLIGFAIVGILKGVVNHTNKIRSALEIVLMGALAAIVAFYVGYFLEQLLGS